MGCTTRPVPKGASKQVSSVVGAAEYAECVCKYASMQDMAKDATQERERERGSKRTSVYVANDANDYGCPGTRY